MDLVQTVRKEGTRGGRDEFKWEDVKNSAHRENYLGHSLMAPVGRWQQNKDLSWYARGDGESEKSEAELRKQEINRVKEAEEEAFAKALGYEIPPRSLPDGENPNLTALGNQREINASKSARDKSVEDGKDYGKPRRTDQENSKKSNRRRHEDYEERRWDKDRRGQGSRRHERSRDHHDRQRHRDSSEDVRDSRHGDDSRSRFRTRQRSRSHDRKRERNDRKSIPDSDHERRRSRSPRYRHDNSTYRR